VNNWFAKARPQAVFLVAAKVGGIVANNSLRGELLYDNLIIAANVIHAAHVSGTKLMFLGSSCIYPKLAPQPLRENSMLTGPLGPTNEPYAIANIAGIKTVEASQPVRLRLHQRDADQSVRARPTIITSNTAMSSRP